MSDGFVGGGWQNGDNPFKGFLTQVRDNWRKHQKENEQHTVDKGGQAGGTQEWVDKGLPGPSDPTPAPPRRKPGAVKAGPKRPTPAQMQQATMAKYAYQTMVNTGNTAHNTGGNPGGFPAAPGGAAMPRQFSGYHQTPGGIWTPG